MQFLQKRWSKSSFLALLVLLVTVSLKNFSLSAQEKQKPKIVSTFLPIYLFTKAVTGNQGQVDILIPPGAEIHDYQASPQDTLKLNQADILVINGLGIEEFLDKLVANAQNSNLKEIIASQGIEVIKDNELEEEHHHEHEHKEGNPHVWLDPVLAQTQVANIRDGLIAADSANSQIYTANAQAYIQQLQELDRLFATRLAPFKNCKFIAFHDAFPYLAKRYGIEQMAIVELPEDNITPRDLQRVTNAAKQYQVNAILSGPGVNDKRVEQIAKDLNLSIEILDPLESGELDPQYYFAVMQKNLESLEKACK